MSAGVTAWNGRATRDLYLAAVDAVAVILAAERAGCEHLDGPYRKVLAEHAEAKRDYELLGKENFQLREALGMARKEYGGKNIADLDEYDKLRLAVNGFQAMNGVLELRNKRQHARITELEDRELQLQEQAGEMAEELEKLRRTSVVDHPYAGPEIKVGFEDDRPRLLPSFWATPSNAQSRICDLCGALIADVKPVPGSMPDARAAHRRWHANHPDYRTNCRFCGEPESATVWCCDARMEASEQGEG
jgi:hypothetical protein